MPTTAESVAAAFGLLWFWSAGSKRRSNNPSEERPDIPVAPPE
jgi:hypothetical protein